MTTKRSKSKKSYSGAKAWTAIDWAGREHRCATKKSADRQAGKNGQVLKNSWHT